MTRQINQLQMPHVSRERHGQNRNSIERFEVRQPVANLHSTRFVSNLSWKSKAFMRLYEATLGHQLGMHQYQSKVVECHIFEEGGGTADRIGRCCRVITEPCPISDFGSYRGRPSFRHGSLAAMQVSNWPVRFNDSIRHSKPVSPTTEVETKMTRLSGALG